ncbi:MAG: hypothetical protein H7A44_03035 [Opitutaceae bacterium]|nr:hypothetical protein [Cephaloticoccus sp.]MCP5529392.1 hypothetical protein [Opitutaceae bacterium]
MRLSLPANINADGLLPFIAHMGEAGSGDAIEIDFTELRRVSPAGLVALTAQINLWRNKGLLVYPLGLEVCPILGYLQRMDLLRSCNFTQPESFIRHDAKGRFVPVRVIDHRVTEMGSEMALCVAPGGDEYGHPLAGPYDLVWYVLTEMANNVRQHSGGQGFVAAQVGRGEGLVRLAIADNGNGILSSFIGADLAWAKGIDDTTAILKALEARVSSKGSPTNEGVGLTLTARMAELASAWLLIVSGTGVVRQNPGDSQPLSSVLPDGGVYPGTLVALTFRQDQVLDYAQLLDQAKQASGLLRPRHNRARFGP